ncbi:MAG: AI-2E family transporter [Ruminococcus sp.]|nr:AI-2E family transporter [Ruminococcus sp.]
MKKKFSYLKVFWLITYTLIVAFLLINIKQVGTTLSNIFSVFMPFIYGFILAYILSFPYNFFYDRCFKKIGTKRKKLFRLKKPLALLISYLLCFGVVGLLVGFLIPELSKSIARLIDDIPIYAQSIQKWFDSLVIFVREQFGYDLYDENTYNEIVNFLTGKDAQDVFKNFISDAFPAALNFGKVFTTGLYNWIIGIVVSIYMLSSKEKLCRQARAVVVAYLPIKTSRRVLQITDLSNKKCGKFIIGKIIDSLIIGLICFIGLSIFKFDYALLISVIVGVTNVIPFFGPFIGAIPCAFLLLLIDPLQSFWFVVFVIILQQFDGNILGPKILGETVGISGFWILFSVIVGGGLFGLPGMLLGVPVFAVIYTLIDDGVTKRLKEKSSSSKINELSAELDALDDGISKQGSISESEINKDGSDENN